MKRSDIIVPAVVSTILLASAAACYVDSVNRDKVIVAQTDEFKEEVLRVFGLAKEKCTDPDNCSFSERGDGSRRVELPNGSVLTLGPDGTYLDAKGNFSFKELPWVFRQNYLPKGRGFDKTYRDPKKGSSYTPMFPVSARLEAPFDAQHYRDDRNQANNRDAAKVVSIVYSRDNAEDEGVRSETWDNSSYDVHSYVSNILDQVKGAVEGRCLPPKEQY